VNYYTKPATTTPPTRREHPAAIFSFPPPLMLTCDGPAASRCAAKDLYLPVCWPSSRRTAAPRRVRAPGPFMLPSSPSPCDVSVNAGCRAVECFAGDVRCAAAPPRAAPLVSRQPRRAGMARPRVRKHGCVRALWTEPLASRAARAAARDSLQLLGDPCP
jgi:hypothetical protein